MGAPVVGEFFEELLTEEKLVQLSERSEGFDIASSEVVDDRPAVKSIYRGGGSSRSSSGGGGSDRPAQPKPAAEPEKKQGGLRGFFNRLRGN